LEESARKPLPLRWRDCQLGLSETLVITGLLSLRAPAHPVADAVEAFLLTQQLAACTAK